MTDPAGGPESIDGIDGLDRIDGLDGLAHAPGWRNPVVSVAALPPVDDAPFEPLDPRYLKQQRAIWLVLLGAASAVAVAIWVIASGPAVGLVAVGVAVVVAAVTSWVLEGLAFGYRGVQLRELDVSTRRGLISRTTVSVPFTRVQHVTVQRGLLDRLFGLSEVVIYTAGAAAADARAKGLDPDRADRLREDILNRSRRLDPPNDESQPSPAASTLYANDEPS